MIKIRFVFTVLPILLSFKTSRYIEFISIHFFLVGEGGGAFIRGSIHLEGASIRGLFFGSVGRRSSAGGGAKGGSRGAKKRKFYTLQSTRVNIWLRLERQVHASSMSTSIYSKSLHLIIILFNYRNRKK